MTEFSFFFNLFRYLKLRLSGHLLNDLIQLSMAKDINRLLGFDYKIGDIVEVIDENGDWYQAKIINLNLESQTTPYTLHCQALPGQGYNMFQFSVPEGDYRKCHNPIKTRIKFYKMKMDLYWRNKLIQLHQHPDRLYHNLARVNDLFKKLRTVDHDFNYSELKIINCALIFYNAVYDTTQPDNREMCIGMVKKFNKTRNFLSQKELEKIETMIMATKNHLNHPPGDFIVDLFLDLDLSALALPKNKFIQYNDLIRQEYPFMPDDVFLPKRKALLEKYKSAPKIFKTSWGSKFEKRAKNNLKLIK